MTVIWERSGNAYYAVIRDPADEVQFRMIVEPAGDGWDWSTWRPGSDQRVAGYGVAKTVQDAMREAEGAAE